MGKLGYNDDFDAAASATAAWFVMVLILSLKVCAMVWIRFDTISAESVMNLLVVDAASPAAVILEFRSDSMADVTNLLADTNAVLMLVKVFAMALAIGRGGGATACFSSPSVCGAEYTEATKMNKITALNSIFSVFFFFWFTELHCKCDNC